MDTQLIGRYHRQSLRLLDSALEEMRLGRCSRCEDLLWGSLTLAVKGVALSRGDRPHGEAAVREYAITLGEERRDRRILEAFGQLGALADPADLVLETRYRGDRLAPVLEDITSAVERLWEMAPGYDQE